MIPEYRGRGIGLADTHFSYPSNEPEDTPLATRLPELLRSFDWALLPGDTTDTLPFPKRVRLDVLKRIISRSVWTPTFRAFRQIRTIQQDGNHDLLAVYQALDTPYWRVLASVLRFRHDGNTYQSFHGHTFDRFRMFEPLIELLGDRFDPLIKALDHRFSVHDREEKPNAFYERWARPAIRNIRRITPPGLRSIFGHFHLVVDRPRLLSPGLTTRKTLRYVVFENETARLVKETLG